VQPSPISGAPAAFRKPPETWKSTWDLERVPEGTYQLDWRGRIARHAPRQPGADGFGLLDRDLFDELAPCGNSGQLKSLIQDGAADGRLDLTLLFSGVAVTLYYSDVTQTAWVFVKRL
jgi:hypothetical protein